MKKNLFLTIALFGGLFLFAASCAKEIDINEKYRPVGGEIVFSAATGYDNGVETRTEYTGDMKTVSGYTNQFERIDWVTNDPLKIYYRRGTGSYQNATYKITGSNNASNEITKASATADGTKLYWADGSGDHKFYGMYPANGFQGNTSAQLSNNRASGSIPATQNIIAGSQKTQEGIAKYMPDMKYAYMVCYQEVASNSNSSSVELPFRPAMTAFEFRFKLGNQFGTNSVVVKSFKLTSTANTLTGNFAFDITGKDAHDRATIGTVATSNTGNEINVSFGDNGVTMNKTDILDFTVFALPVDQTGLTIEFTFAATEAGASDFTRKLDLKHSGSFVTFDACKKYVITNTNIPSEVWDYYLEANDDITEYGHGTVSDLPFTITSYKVKRGTTTRVPVAWTAAVTAATSAASSYTNSTSYLTLGSSSYSGSETVRNNTANIVQPAPGAVEGGGAPGDAAAATMALNPVKGSTSSRYDLSLYDVHGNAHTGETANCYVINSPGYYKFPLVYGNAIKGGAPNTNAYAPSKATNSNTYMTPFKRSDNNAITGPYILTNMGLSASQVEAAIVWQDVDENETSLILQENTTDHTYYGIDNSGNGYIWFDIQKENIKQGNVVIAVRKKSDHSILWSWHLWFTEKDLTPVPTKTHLLRGDNTVEFMPYNLGWTDRSDAKTEAYPTRTWTVTVTQAESGNTDGIIVKQIGEVTRIDANFGTCTFYEFGRKDPELPFRDRNNNKKYTAGFTGNGTNRYLLVDPNETVTLHVINSVSGMDVATGIQNPQAHIFNATTTCWIGNSDSNTPLNLWSANITQNAQDTPTVKTVYDPCPPGFCVPRLWAYSNFAYVSTAPGNTTYPVNGVRMPADIGFNFPTKFPNPAHVFFPASGSRAHDDAGPQYLDEWGNYWTAAAVEYGGPYTHGKTLNFRFILNQEPTINVQFDRWKSCAYTVRPAVEETAVNYSNGGMEGNSYEFNDGWTIN